MKVSLFTMGVTKTKTITITKDNISDDDTSDEYAVFLADNDDNDKDALLAWLHVRDNKKSSKSNHKTKDRAHGFQQQFPQLFSLDLVWPQR